MRRAAARRRRRCSRRSPPPPAGRGAPAGQLLGQPPDAGRGLGRPRRRALRPRPGRDPDLPGARPSRRRRCSPRKRAEVAARLQRARRRPRACRCARAGRAGSAFPHGQGGLRTTRVELSLSRAGQRRRAASRCATTRSPAASAGRPSLVAPGRGTAVRSSVPQGDPTSGLRGYPQVAAVEPAGPARGDASRCARAAATVDGAEGPRRGLRRRRRAARATASPACSRTPPPGAARSPPAAGRVRLGRAARALARARQGDGRRLPGRHARHLARRASRSARP